MERPADLSVGSFSDLPPWLVEPPSMRWRDGIDRIRSESAAEVPCLTKRRLLPPGSRVVRTGWVVGREMAIWWLRERGTPQSRARLSRRLRHAFEKLGPTYIKLGQILSSGQGIFPDELVREMEELRDRVRPETFSTVRRVVEEDLGTTIEAVFSSFDVRPLASASIAQVHAARLRSGENVVVKVQRPQVASLVRSDLRAMSWIAPVLVGRIPVSALANPPALVDLFAETIVEELDFRLEAQNMLDVARVLAATEQRAIVVPRPHPTLVTRRVLVMERMDGFSFDDVDGMLAAGIDTAAVVQAGLVAFLEGAVLFGVFHGDLHGGNLFVQPDGRVALLDYGITGRLSEPRRLAFLRLLMGGTINDLRLQMAALRDLGALPPDTDIEAVIRDLNMEGPVIDPATMDPEDFLAAMRDLVKSLLGYGARLPKELMLFFKDLLFLSAAMNTLAPDVDLFNEITKVATYFATTHGERITADVGIDPRRNPVDLGGFKASMGLSDEVAAITPRELAERRAQIAKRMRERKKG